MSHCDGTPRTPRTELAVPLITNRWAVVALRSHPTGNDLKARAIDHRHNATRNNQFDNAKATEFLTKWQLVGLPSAQTVLATFISSISDLPPLNILRIFLTCP